MKSIKCVILAVFSFLWMSHSFAQIQAGKSINITIANVPAVDKSQVDNIYPVSEAGIINMPYIGQIRAAGLSSDSLAAVIQNRYKSAQIYTNPTIQVIENAGGRDVNQEVVTVGGHVKSAGPIPYVKEMNLWQAIQNAKGPTEFGSMKRVRVTRGAQSKEYNLNKPENRTIVLQRNDSIEVPQKRPFE